MQYHHSLYGICAALLLFLFRCRVDDTVISLCSTSAREEQRTNKPTTTKMYQNQVGQDAYTIVSLFNCFALHRFLMYVIFICMCLNLTPLHHCCRQNGMMLHVGLRCCVHPSCLLLIFILFSCIHCGFASIWLERSVSRKCCETRWVRIQRSAAQGDAQASQRAIIPTRRWR